MSVNRYRQLLASVPTGQFYASDGQVIPYKGTNPNAVYAIRITTSRPTYEHAVYVNDVYTQTITTDGSGVANLALKLEHGKNIIKLHALGTNDSVSAAITTRDYATMLAALAASIEDLDTKVEQVLADSHLATSSAALIEQVFGLPLKTVNYLGYDLETFRELLQELKSAYRHYGSTLEGMSRIVRAFTQTSPLYYKRQFGPAWVLSKDFISPKVSTARHTYFPDDGTITWTLPSACMHVSAIADTMGYVGTGNISAREDLLSGKRYIKYRSSVVGIPWGDEVEVTGNGTYTLYDGKLTPVIVSVPGTFDIVNDVNDYIVLEFGSRGRISVRLNTGSAQTATDLANDINATMAADTRYGINYSAVAYALPSATNDRLAIRTSNAGVTVEDIRLHQFMPTVPVDGGDGTQTIFDLAQIRSGLRINAGIGSTSITLSSNTDMATWPSLTTSDTPIRLMIGRSTYQIIGTTTPSATIVISPAYVRASSINKSTRVVTLLDPVPTDYYAGALVEMDNQFPYVFTTQINRRPIEVAVEDRTLITTTPTDGTFSIGGSGLPDGWYQHDNAFAPVPSNTGPSTVEHFNVDRDLPMLFSYKQTYTYIPVNDEILDYKGYMMNFSVWASPSHFEAGTEVDIVGMAVSYDGGATWISSAPSVLDRVVSATNKPRHYMFQSIISPSATKCLVRIEIGTGSIRLCIHRVRVTVPGVHGGLFLGDGTTPRHESKVKSSGIVYIWSPEQLSPHEDSALGITSNDQTIAGHIDRIAPAKLWLDKYDVSEYSGPTPLNVVGSFSNSSFSSGIMSNMSVVLRSPSRFTYLKPDVVSKQTETVVWNIASQFDVQYESTQTDAILFENGVPLAGSDWQWNSSTQIEILSSIDTSATYEIKYVALISYETPAIDLGLNYADYMWMADYHAFLRPDVHTAELDIGTGLQFDGNGVATLPDMHNNVQALATITEDTGIVSRTVPISTWRFSGTNQVIIDLDAFNPDALYSITYKAIIPDPSPSTTINVELRSAVSIMALASATYSTVIQNQVIDTFRYHQLRATVNNVRDVRDIRLQSLLIKGLDLYGSGGSVPIIRP